MGSLSRRRYCNEKSVIEVVRRDISWFVSERVRVGRRDDRDASTVSRRSSPYCASIVIFIKMRMICNLTSMGKLELEWGDRCIYVKGSSPNRQPKATRAYRLQVLSSSSFEASTFVVLSSRLSYAPNWQRT
jgi:hypothetical protein